MADISVLNVPVNGTGTSYNLKDTSAVASVTLSDTNVVVTKRNGNTSSFALPIGYLGSVTPSSVGTTNSGGTSTVAARADHVHKLSKATVTTALGYTPPETDHTYTAATGAPAAIPTSTLSVTGTSANYARQDHTHGLTKASVTTALGYTPPESDTTYSVVTTAADGLMSAADKTKLDGIATSANNYTHPTTAGNKHIPSGGSSGQILGWSAAGTATWIAGPVVVTTITPSTSGESLIWINA